MPSKYYAGWKFLYMAAGCIFSLTGCNTFETSVYKKPAMPQLAEGIPYHLPRGVVEFSIEVEKNDEGKFESVNVKSETTLIPDPDLIYLINLNQGLLTHKVQKITLAGGMLSSIHTEDEGQIDEVAKAIAGTWVNIMKIGVLKGTITDLKAVDAVKIDKLVALPQAPPNFKQGILDHYPEVGSMDQIKTILDTADTFYNGALSYLQSRVYSTPLEKETFLEEAGTVGNRIVFEGYSEPVTINYGRNLILTVAQKPVKEVDNTVKKYSDNAADDIATTTLSGIMVKVPEPRVYKVELSVIPKKLYLHRLTKYNDQIKSLNKKIAEGKDASGKLPDLNNKIKDQKRAINETLEEINAKKKNNQSSADLEITLKLQESNLEKLESKKEKYEALKETGEDSEKKLSQVVRDVQVNLVLIYHLIGRDRLGTRPDNLFERSMVAMVPSQYAVNVPLKNSWIGKTTYDLELDRGVLTSFGVEKPAEMVEVARLPLDVTGEIVDLLTKFISFRIDMVGKRDEYAEAKIELAKTEFELKQLGKEQEKEDLELQKELKDARFELEKQQKEQLKKVLELELELENAKFNLEKLNDEQEQKIFELKIALDKSEYEYKSLNQEQKRKSELDSLEFKKDRLVKMNEIRSEIVKLLGLIETQNLEIEKLKTDLKSEIENNKLEIQQTQNEIDAINEDGS